MFRSSGGFNLAGGEVFSAVACFCHGLLKKVLLGGGGRIGG